MVANRRQPESMARERWDRGENALSSLRKLIPFKIYRAVEFRMFFCKLVESVQINTNRAFALVEGRHSAKIFEYYCVSTHDELTSSSMYWIRIAIGSENPNVFMRAFLMAEKSILCISNSATSRPNVTRTLSWLSA